MWLPHVAFDMRDLRCGDGCAMVIIITASIVILTILVMLMAMAAVVEMLLLIAIDVTMLVLILMTSLAIAMLIRQHDLHIVFANILNLKWWQLQHVRCGVINTVINNHDNDRNGIMTALFAKRVQWWCCFLPFGCWLCRRVLQLDAGDGGCSRAYVFVCIGHAMSVLCHIVEDAWAYFPPFVNLTFARVCVWHMVDDLVWLRMRWIWAWTCVSCLTYGRLLIFIFYRRLVAGC